jgi:RHS repeat-associated protein
MIGPAAGTRIWIVAGVTDLRRGFTGLSGMVQTVLQENHADGLGSVTSLSSSAGSIANTYTYDSFGNLTNSTGSLTNSFRYTAREFDTETSLYYYRARYYDPNAGRFLSEDPIGFHAGIDQYRYALNNPTKYRDPSGLWPWDKYFKPKPLDDQTQVDQQIYDITSRFATDPFLMAKCKRAVYLAEINQLAYLNLEIDAVLQGGMAIGLLAKYPELIGQPQDQMLDMLGKLRDANNRKIDSLLGQAALEPLCGCNK